MPFPERKMEAKLYDRIELLVDIRLLSLLPLCSFALAYRNERLLWN